MSKPEDSYALLSAERLMQLFSELETELPSDTHTELAITGGAAMLFSSSERRTQDVDVISDFFPQYLRDAVRRISSRHNLRKDWMNDGAKAFAPNISETEFKAIYSGEKLVIWLPDDRHLLATKLQAARDKDFRDAVRLVKSLGIENSNELLDLVEEAYEHRNLPPKVQYFISAIAEELGIE